MTLLCIVISYIICHIDLQEKVDEEKKSEEKEEKKTEEETNEDEGDDLKKKKEIANLEEISDDKVTVITKAAVSALGAAAVKAKVKICSSIKDTLI